MKETLRDIKSRLRGRDYTNEEQVRLCVVTRILQKLDWDVWNPAEVFAEFMAVPYEDKTRVDLALFLHPQNPAVFIEIKAVGQLQKKLHETEKQVRDYNRNNTALFSVLTDGREWRFYYSQTGGEFSKKCFITLNIETGDLEEIEHSFFKFLKKSEIETGAAKGEAERKLQLNQVQQAMELCLPQARRLILEPPFPSLGQVLVDLVKEKGFQVSKAEVVEFIKISPEQRLIHAPVSDLKDRDPSAPKQRRILNPEQPENLAYTKIIEGTFGDEDIADWKDLMNCAILSGLNRGLTYKFLSSFINMRETKSLNLNFHQIEGTSIWIYAMESNRIWKRTLKIARKISAPIKLLFYWRDKKGTAYPGEEGLLEWSPS